MPVTVPVLFTDPVAGLLLLHVPPAVASVSDVVDASHTAAADGEMAATAGDAFTVSVLVWMAVQLPEATAYVIFVVPAETPVTFPEASMLPVAGLPLLHVPPVVASASVTNAPVHTDEGPVMAATTGSVFTVTVAVAVQVFVPVYVITEVPGLTPVTRPLPDPTVAIPVLPLTHVPPPGVPVSVVVAPVVEAGGQTVSDPDIEGDAITVTVADDAHPVDSV